MNDADVIKALEEALREADKTINRQKAEIERLEKHNTEYARKYYNDGRAEAITEFAERLKNYYNKLDKSRGSLISFHIDQIAKEMKEGVNNEG